MYTAMFFFIRKACCFIVIAVLTFFFGQSSLSHDIVYILLCPQVYLIVKNVSRACNTKPKCILYLKANQIALT